MRLAMTLGLLSVGLALGASAVAFGQATEDEIAKGGQFPLAAKAGQDSHAFDQAPPGAVNQGKFDMDKWKYGHAWDAPAGGKIWNPVKLKMMRGQKGRRRHRVQRHRSGNLLRHGQCRLRLHLDRAAAFHPRLEGCRADVGDRCPFAKAVPGVRVAYTDEREEQHAMDAGALVLVVPTVRSYEEAIKARDWAYFPAAGQAQPGRRPGVQHLRQCARRLSPDHQRQSGADPDDRDLGRPQGCRPHRQDPRRHRDLRRQRRSRQFCRHQAGRSGLRARDQHRA